MPDAPPAKASSAKIVRIHRTLTSEVERRALTWLCRRMPRWVTSDLLTLLGALGGLLTLIAFACSWRGPGWLWLAILGLAINWFGDSLDGSLARFRKAERNTYGFFLDHMVDSLVMGMIAIGIGLSPYAHLASGFAVLSAYYLMVILTLATCVVTGNFRISFSGIGPTEIRLLIAACIVFEMLFPTGTFNAQGLTFTVWDALMAFFAAALAIAFAAEALATARRLAAAEPPK